MNILQLNKYITLNGGSETVMKNLSEILQGENHNVTNMGFVKADQPLISDSVISLGSEKLKITDMFINRNIETKIISFISDNNIETVICHNIYHHFPILNILKSIKSKTKAKIVMYLHDYKVVCPTYSLLLNGKVCEKCRNKQFNNVSKNKCKDNSLIKSTIINMESDFNNKYFDAYKYIDLFISPSHFLKKKVKELGFKHKVKVIHNPTNFSVSIMNPCLSKNTILYAGRLSEEKGISNLIEVIKQTPSVNYIIAGGGPLQDEILELQKTLVNVEYVGYLNHEELKGVMNKSSFLYIPSVWYENNPMIVLEAMSCGLPVIGSSYGGIPELLENERGYIVDVDNTEKNIKQIKELISQKHDKYKSIINNAKEFLSSMSYEEYYVKLENLFKEQNIWEK